MKKQLLFALTLFQISFLIAQESLDKLPVDVNSEEGFTVRQVGYMAIFPGCESIDENDKINLQKCVSKELSALLTKELKPFYGQMEKDGYSRAVAKVQFVIDKNGKIVQIEALKGANEDLGIASEMAFERISSKLKKIKPAALKDGTPVNLVFQLPIRLQLEVSFLHEFQWKEMTIATLKEENKIYEIRQDKSKNIKVYEILNGKETFLGKFLSTQEIFNSEPYKSILIRDNQHILLAEKTVKKILYRLYYSTEKPNSIDIFKVVDGEEVWIESILQSEIEGYRNYLAVVLRN
ncbi:energy transducer TonB [Moheibacter lacus]|uniref:TonB protein C-terminal n=1 Tax=Moheibacter lacus TaxID=2745851 RepID=A0A838ZRZ0_9FLAO|nr:hypothetical protein [Moheibacter lacus]MBA5628699.1 hypothetical protein [Moheibacter lacus]